VDIDGVQWSHEQIRSAIAHQVEAETKKAALPQSPADYQVALPADWTPPIDGVRFEFDKNDPLLARAQELAHARGIGQSAFSDMLGVYAANRISELQRVNAARSAELGKLGSAATQRIDGIARWLQAYAGADAAVMINQLRQYPVSSMVSMWERVIRTFSDQGGATAPSGGRAEPDMSGRIPGYENMSYSQRRAAQDQIKARRGGR
jgi:hypothetical protein